MGDMELAELDPELRALIDLAKGTWEPMPWQQARVHARLELTLQATLSAQRSIEPLPRNSSKT